MHLSTTTTALAAAALALAAAQSAAAQGSAAPSSSSSSAPSRTSTGTTASSSSTAANPLIPSTISPKCQTFLTYLNSHQDISTCTAPLLSALSTFQASAASSDYSANDAAVQDALAGLCYSAPCDDALVRSLLTQFNSNCTQELTAANDVVLGSYDALYVLTPLRDAVCSTDSTADWCINDIAQGSMPAGSTGANATHVVSSVASSYAAAATASIDAGSSAAPASSSSSSSAVATNETEATFNTTTHLVQSVPVVNNARILAAQDSSSFEIDVPAPPSLYVQISGAVKRLVRRQWNGDLASSAWSSASPSASRSGSSAQASASASSTGANSTASASNSTTSSSSSSSASLGDDSTTAGVQSFDVPSILPNAATWSSASLPFLFLSPSMSSTVLCSQCTKSILSAYVAWESRMPYALGLANSPLLKGQGSLWTATGEKCGGGFLESVTKQAGETNLTGGAAQGLAVRASGVLGAVVLAATFLLA
ncbi:hypothetical protein JCM9279_006260 [Rhodotorula babjevae]